MKRLKKLMSIAMIMIIILFNLTSLYSKTSATIIYKGEEVDLLDRVVPIYGTQSNKYEFNTMEILEYYSRASTLSAEDGKELKFKHEVPVTKDLIPTNSETSWYDGFIDAKDASNFLNCLAVATEYGMDSSSIEKKNNNYKASSYEIAESLANYLNIDVNDIEVCTTVIYPKVDGVNEKEESYTISSKNGVTEEHIEMIEKFGDYNYKIARNHIIKILIENAKKNEGIDLKEEDLSEENILECIDIIKNSMAQQKISVTLVTANKENYKLVVGSDRNFYLEKVTTEKPSEEKKDFSTELEYTAISGSEKLEGKMSADGSTFLPPYYDNDDSKKDADAIATIISKTDEEIVATDGVTLTNDGKANSKGWYYPNLDNKKVIAKDYPFDDYDNTKYNGIIKETVKLTGAEGGTDTQTPSIQWTFRRKTTDKKTNSDESITVTITYNLPVDPDSIPDGWEPVYDSDGQTIHKITRTFKKGEEYDKDVTVKQNGTGVTNTTPVTITWPKDDGKKEELPTVLAKTGETTKYILIAFIAGLAIFAVIRYRKLKNKR